MSTVRTGSSMYKHGLQIVQARIIWKWNSLAWAYSDHRIAVYARKLGNKTSAGNLGYTFLLQVCTQVNYFWKFNVRVKFFLLTGFSESILLTIIFFFIYHTTHFKNKV